MLILIIGITIPDLDMLIFIISIAIPEGGIAIPDAGIAIPGAWRVIPGSCSMSRYSWMVIQNASITIYFRRLEHLCIITRKFPLDSPLTGGCIVGSKRPLDRKSTRLNSSHSQ